jgi:hypothetical protein
MIPAKDEFKSVLAEVLTGFTGFLGPFEKPALKHSLAQQMYLMKQSGKVEQVQAHQV